MYGKISCNDYLFKRKGRKGMRKLNRGKNKIFHKGILTFLMIFLIPLRNTSSSIIGAIITEEK